MLRVKMLPCLCNTTLPSALLLVRDMKNPSICIIGDAESTFSASTDPCWLSEGTAHRGQEEKRNHLNLSHATFVPSILINASVSQSWM